MSKYRVVTKKGISYIELKGRKEQQLCERELHSLNSGVIENFIPAEVIQKRTHFVLKYKIASYISLKEYLRYPLNKKKFARLLQDILTFFKELQEQHINQQYILLDAEYVFVDSNTEELKLICIPIQFYDTETPLKEFLLSIIRLASFETTEDTSYVSEYITLLNREINFSVFELSEYVQQLNAPKSIQTQMQKKCPQCHSMIRMDSKYCTVCGTLLLRTTIIDEKKAFNPLYQDETKIQPDTNSGNQNERNAIIQKENITEEVTYREKIAYLVHMSTSKRVAIGKFPFRVGKSSYGIDYSISGNAMVSRIHAEFSMHNDKYYLIDLKSTNRTFINGVAIPPGEEIELLPGSHITFANEEFCFFVE